VHHDPTAKPRAENQGVEEVPYLHELLPDAVKSKGTLTIATNPTYAPAQFTDADGSIVGYEIDLARDVATILGLEADVRFAEFDTIISSLGQKYDLGASTFTITNEREKSANIVEVYRMGERFAVQKGNPKHIEQPDLDGGFKFLCGKRVSVQTATTHDYELTDNADVCAKNRLPEWTLLRYQSQSMAMTAVAEGETDVTYSDSPVIDYAISQNPDKVEAFGSSTNVAPIGLALSKEDIRLAVAVQEAVQYLIDSGNYKKILEKWGLHGIGVEFAKINPTIPEQIRDGEGCE
jgi:polar amino acid transport system substrate-binding protein